MAIKDWPARERPRERLLSDGPGSLSDAELLAIFLRTGVSGTQRGRPGARTAAAFRQPAPAARRRSRAASARHPGLGNAKYAQLQAVLEMGRRHLGEQLERGAALLSPRDTERFLQARLRDYALRGVRGAVSRQPAPRHRLRGAVSRHHRRRQRVSARGCATRAAAQRRRGDPQSQPSVGRGRAKPGRPAHHPAPARRAGAGRRAACSTTWSSVTGTCCSLAERGLHLTGDTGLDPAGGVPV